MKSKENIYILNNPLYRAYVENGNSVAIAITKYVVKSINTKNKWVDIIELDGKKDEFKNNMWDFNSFKIEVFPRKTKPIYPKGATQEEIDFITWQTAANDINILKNKGYNGSQYEIKPNLYKVRKREKDKWKYTITSVKKIR